MLLLFQELEDKAVLHSTRLQAARGPMGCGPGALPQSGLQALSSLCQDLPPAPQPLSVYTHREV